MLRLRQECNIRSLGLMVALVGVVKIRNNSSSNNTREVKVSLPTTTIDAEVDEDPGVLPNKIDHVRAVVVVVAPGATMTTTQLP